MAKTYTYWVTGMGQFPTDMLRYDRAKAIAVVEQTTGTHTRVFHLIHGDSKPTEGRWTSFLWSVIDTPVKAARWNLPDPREA